MGFRPDGAAAKKLGKDDKALLASWARGL